MIRTCLLCNSSARPDRWPVRPGSGGRRRAQPCLRTPRSYSRDIPLCLFRRGRFETLRCSLVFLDDLLEVVAHGRKRLARDLHLAVRTFADDEIKSRESGIFFRIIVAEVRAAALLAFERSARNGLGNCQNIEQVERGVPPGIVVAIAVDGYVLRA